MNFERHDNNFQKEPEVLEDESSTEEVEENSDEDANRYGRFDSDEDDYEEPDHRFPVYRLASEEVESKTFPEDINEIILETLKHLGRSKYYGYFRNNPDTLPLVANAVNELAKTDSKD